MFELVKGFLVFDTITLTETKARKILEGWEHKEKITPIYAIVDKEEKASLQELGEVSAVRINMFKEDQLELANQELEEMNK